MKMRTVSNIASSLALVLVIVSFILNAAGLTHIPIKDITTTGLFIKGAFIQIDISCWIQALKTSL